MYKKVHYQVYSFINAFFVVYTYYYRFYPSSIYFPTYTVWQSFYVDIIPEFSSENIKKPLNYFPREQKEDDDLREIMQQKGFVLSPLSYDTRRERQKSSEFEAPLASMALSWFFSKSKLWLTKQLTSLSEMEVCDKNTQVSPKCWRKTKKFNFKCRRPNIYS